MAPPLSTTLPLRFVLTILHFMAAILVFWHKVGPARWTSMFKSSLSLLRQEANIAASFSYTPTTSQLSDANHSIKAALGLTMICFFFHFLGIVSGVSLFSGKVTFLQMVCQFVGGVLTAWFIIDRWRYQTFWWIWGFCSFLPATAEVLMLAFTFGFKVIEY